MAEHTTKRGKGESHKGGTITIRRVRAAAPRELREPRMVTYIDCERRVSMERRGAYEEGVSYGIAITVNPKKAEKLVKDLAIADARVIKSGRTHGRVIEPGYLWGERKTIDRMTLDKHEKAVMIVNELRNDMRVDVTPDLLDAEAFMTHMRVYNDRQPLGRSLNHLKIKTLTSIYRKQLEVEMEDVPTSAAPDDRTKVTKTVTKHPTTGGNTTKTHRNIGGKLTKNTTSTNPATSRK